MGETVNPKRRLDGYNTGDPNRSYRMILTVDTLDRRTSEWLAHERLTKLGYPRQGEWFQVAPAVAGNILHKAVAQAERGDLLR